LGKTSDKKELGQEYKNLKKESKDHYLKLGADDKKRYDEEKKMYNANKETIDENKDKITEGE